MRFQALSFSVNKCKKSRTKKTYNSNRVSSLKSILGCICRNSRELYLNVIDTSPKFALQVIYMYFEVIHFLGG